MSDTPTPRLARLRVFPIKSLDGVAVERAAIGPDGGLRPDRQLALVDADGEYVNGKRTATVHRIRADFDLETRTVSLRVPDATALAHDPVSLPCSEPPDPITASLDAHDRLAAWFSTLFDTDVSVVATEPSYPDDTTASGPTVVSQATLERVAEWFDLTVENVRRRFRSNVEFGGVPAFWEDRLYGDRSEHVAFTIGDARFEGEGPCRRCVVPARDPDTGVEAPSFREQFVRRRRDTLPDWSDGERFEGAFRLAVNTVVPPETTGRTVAVGDTVSIDGPVPGD